MTLIVILHLLNTRIYHVGAIVKDQQTGVIWVVKDDELVQRLSHEGM
jgi:hypothetical protein